MSAVAGRSKCGLPVAHDALGAILSGDTAGSSTHRSRDNALALVEISRSIAELSVSVLADDVLPDLCSLEAGRKAQCVVINVVADSNSADEVSCQADECEILPVICSTGLTAEHLVLELSRGTCTVFNNVLQEPVHNVSSLLRNSSACVSVVGVEHLVVSVLDTGNDMSLVVGTLISVGDIGVDQIFQSDAPGKGSNCQR